MKQTPIEFDALERGMTNAVIAISDSAAQCGSTENPLAIVCRCIVACVPAVQFAAYVEEDRGVWQVAAVRAGYRYEQPAPAVARKFTLFLRKKLETADSVALSSKETAPFVPPAKRRKWRQTTCLAFAVKVQGQRVALITLFCPDDMELTLRERRWLDIFSSLASAFCQYQERIRKDGKAGGRVVLKNNASAAAWAEANLASPCVKAIVGLRGAGKLRLMHAIRQWVLRERGVDEDAVVFIDCEDAHSRLFRSVEDVLKLLAELHRGRREHFLFVNEIASAPWSGDLIARLNALGTWNVWVTSSSMLASGDGKGECRPEVVAFHQWTDPNRPRALETLERVWCQIFMRDAIHCTDHIDLRTLEAVAEHTSERLGEPLSLRQMTADLKNDGISLSPNSVRAYLQALRSAHLIEAVPVYDVFEHREVVGMSMKVFWSDLELRNWRFGPASENDSAQLAENRFYLDLRRKYGKVYTPRGGEGDLLTFEPNGDYRFWSFA